MKIIRTVLISLFYLFIIISSLFFINYFHKSSYHAYAQTISPTPTISPDWSTVAHDPQRTSASPEQVTGNISDNSIKVIWYRPIEAYIPQNSQVIAANNMLYIATANGLYALDPNTGDVKWRYDTEMPLGDSPTVVNGVVYVGSMDKRLLAINANTGVKIWSFDNAKAGYSTNPLVLTNTGKPVIYIGNRDGKFYAIQDNGSSPQLLWTFTTQGPINFSAAASKDNSTIYFASNDNYAYALNSTNGSLIWKSAKLPGEGFDSYWPVVYTDRFTGKDFVVFSGAVPYRQGPIPGVTTLEIAPYNYNGWGAWSGVMQSILGTRYGFTGPLPTRAPSNQWEQGKTIVDGTPLVNWLENYPDSSAESGNRGKPWQRTVFVLNASDGSEYTFDSNSNGKSEYAPFAFWGTRNGNSYPPIVGPDNVLYTGNISNNSGVAGNAVMGWETGTPYFSVISNITGAFDEPQALSFGGNNLYRSICCDRYANWQNYSTGASGQIWGYNGLSNVVPGYDDMWYIDNSGYPRWIGWYTGSSQYSYGRSGVYHNHGDQNPIVPYQGKLFIHRSNAIIAIGPTNATTYGNKGDLRIQPTTDPTIPALSVSDAKLRLETEIQKIMAAGDLRIGYYNNGQASMEELVNYFENPGETLYTLAMAYPYLSSSTQTQLVNYLKQEFASYFNPTMYTSRGWTGTAREALDMPPEVVADMQTKPKLTSGQYIGNRSTYLNTYPQFNFYALWKYAQIVSGDTVTAYNLAKSKIVVPAGESDGFLTTFPWRLNNYIAGYIGFLNLQKLAGQDITDGALRTQVTNELARLESLRATNLSPVNNCDTFYGGNPDILCRVLNVGRNFYYLVPELGDYLNKNALSAAQDTITELTYVAPYWMQEGHTSKYLEGVKQDLYDVSLLLGKAYILKQPYSEVAKYIDAPTFAVGDLLYMNNLIAALDSANASLTPTVIPTPVGDINGDGKIDTGDLFILLQNYLTNNIVADLNKDGIVNFIDGGILISNIH